MSIKVKLHPVLHKFTQGQGVIEVNGRNTGQCLREVEKMFPAVREEIRDKRGRLRSYYSVLVNSKYTYPKQLSTPVKDGDEVEIRLIAPGG
jgi:molybdopterin converting factor small subunit